MGLLAAIGAAGGAAAAQPSRATVWSGVFTVAQAERGAAVYASECANCHASNLSGNESVPPLVGTEFVAEYDGKALRELFDTIAMTMPEDSPGRLSRPQYADVLAFIMKSNDFPAGDDELSPDPAELDQIRWQKSR